jgi:3',5'-cyclic AMP phosphodiesterase CpdA
MRLGPLELYKRLPKTNCGDCGIPSCLGFATQVVGYGHDLRDCPHLEEHTFQELDAALTVQRQNGIYVKKDNHKITREHLKEKIQHHDFEAIAPGLGVSHRVTEGEDVLEIPYFDRLVALKHDGVRAEDGRELDPWDRVLLYNYVYFAGSRPLRNQWVGIESFPNSIPKRAALEEGCHRRISEAFAGCLASLEHACRLLGGERVGSGHNADLACRFQALPRVPLLFLFWDEDAEEGFGAQTKVLFDSSATEYLDLEGLCFLAEKLAERLLAMRKEEPNV